MINNVINIPVHDAVIVTGNPSSCPVGCDTPCDNCEHIIKNFMCVDCGIVAVDWKDGTCNGCFDKFLNENQP